MLRVEGLRKRFLGGTPSEVAALDGVTLDVAAGEFVTLIGSNGAGKSTLLRTIAGLVVPDAGRIVLDGRDVTHEPVHLRAAVIGRIAQDPGESTCAQLTIEENLALAARRGQRRGLGWAVTAERRRHFRARLEEIGLGLEGRLAVRVGTLSGGQRQALALLMATLARPRVLLLDEHLASLDPKTAEAVMQLTYRVVSEQRLTALMVTHNMAEALRWGGRLIMMHQGRIILDVAGEQRERLTVPALVERFHDVSRQALAEDRLLLTG